MANQRANPVLVEESLQRHEHFIPPAPLSISTRRSLLGVELVQRAPQTSDRVAYGEYITNAAACYDCHTPFDDQSAGVRTREFAGGNAFKLPGGGIVRTANITPDADTGIGTWTEQQFVDKFKAFDGAPQRTLTAAEQRENTWMPWTAYAGMTREDLGAMYAYLRTLKPIVNRVQKHN